MQSAARLSPLKGDRIPGSFFTTSQFLFKIPNCTHVVCVVLVVVVLVAIVEVLIPGVVIIVLTGTPIVVIGKTTNNINKGVQINTRHLSSACFLMGSTFISVQSRISNLINSKSSIKVSRCSFFCTDLLALYMLLTSCRASLFISWPSVYLYSLEKNLVHSKIFKINL